MAGNDVAGRRVADRYRLDELLGRGGAGAVWRGHDERLNRAVAIKEISFTADAPEAAEIGQMRALREARAAARLRNAGVVQIYDIIEEDGSAFLIMELVDAPNLNVLIRRRGPMSPSDVATFGLAVLDTLVAAHRSGIIHRDVKPSNVLIDGETPRLTDFGIARLGDDAHLTSTGVVMGTPAYIAPEHARGEEVGPAADLYGLGATLYYAVEGVPPFGGGASLPTLMAVVNKPPRAMRRAGHLAPLLGDLLTKDPDERPGAEDVRRRLQAVIEAETPPADEAPAAHGTAVLHEPPSEPEAPVADESPPEPEAPIADGSPPEPEAPIAAEPPVAEEVPPGREPAMPPPETPAAEQEPPDHVAPSAGPEARDEPARDDRGRDDREPRRRPALLAIALVAVLLAAWGLARMGGDGSGEPPEQADARQSAPAAAAPASPAASQAADPAPPSPSPSPSEPASEPASEPPDQGGDGVLPPYDVEVPDDWVEYAPAHTPYRVQHPPGWEVIDRDETITDIRDPESGTYLRLDWVDQRRDPVGAWEAYEPGFAASHEGYRNLGIEPTRHNGNPAALWEYRYREGGAALHAYNLGVNAGDSGYALNLQASQENFAEARELWPYFLASHEFTAP